MQWTVDAMTAGEYTDISLEYWLYMLYTDCVAMWSTVEHALIRTLRSWGPCLLEYRLPA